MVVQGKDGRASLTLRSSHLCTISSRAQQISRHRTESDEMKALPTREILSRMPSRTRSIILLRGCYAVLLTCHCIKVGVRWLSSQPCTISVSSLHETKAAGSRLWKRSGSTLYTKPRGRMSTTALSSSITKTTIDDATTTLLRNY